MHPKNAKIKLQSQLDCIKHVVHTWNNFIEREKIHNLFKEDIGDFKLFKLFKQTYKVGNNWIQNYKTFVIEVNETTNTILCCLEVKKEDDVEKKSLGREAIGQEEACDAIHVIYCSTNHMGIEHTHTYCANKKSKA